MRNKILSFIFLGIIVLVPIITLVSKRSDMEGNQLMIADGNVDKEETLENVISSFMDDVPIKKELAQFNTKFTRQIAGSEYINSTQVILGKNSWLFFKETQADYEHTNRFTEIEKAQILEQLLKQRDILAKVGIEFIVYIAPNKATIYPEYMPDTIVQIDSSSRTEDLLDYIKANSDLTVIYPKEALMAAKDMVPVYYTTDTHWNDVGGYIGTQVFLKEVFGFRDKLLPEMITLKKEYREGDLSRTGNVSDLYREYDYYTIYDTELNASLITDERVYFVGDSFSGAMAYYLPYYIEDVSVIRYENFNILNMYEYSPKVVVWEVVERNIEKFLDSAIIDSTVLDSSYIKSNSKGELYYLPTDAFEMNQDGIRYIIGEEYVKDSIVEAEGFLYCFDEDGFMISRSFREVGEHIHYFGELGFAIQGWTEYDNKWYYFDENYNMVKDGWIQTEDGGWYYMNEDGSMLTDAYTPDGYYVNKDGLWVQ